MPRRKPENRKIDVILMDNDRHLGEKYEVVGVAPVFARNVLLPSGKAILADKMNLHNYQAKMQAAETAREKKAADINELISKIQQAGGIKLSGKINEKETLYAKIHEKEIAAAIHEAHGLEIQTHRLKMKKPIVEPGQYQVPFEYRNVVANLQIHVAGEMDEATRKKFEELNGIKAAEEAVEETTEEETTEDSEE